MAANPGVAGAPEQPLRSAKLGAEGLFGRTIVDPGGRAIGKLHDIVIDVASGRVAYAVIELDQRRHPNRLVVAPWNALLADGDASRLRISVGAERIERAPVLLRGSSADRFARHWASLIHAYFGIVPYWEADPPRPDR